jgi:hypothetical protein
MIPFPRLAYLRAKLLNRRMAPLGGFGLALLGALALLVLPWVAGHTVRGQGPEPKDEIVYLDGDGYIRVLDPALPDVPADPHPVIWHSPIEDGAWRDLAVGDFNGDGDDEIVAVRRSASLGFNLAIYDPVVAPNASLTPEQVRSIPNSQIPWRTLYTTTVPGEIEVVAAGDFDPTTPGAEVWIAYRTQSGFQMEILRRAPGDSDGTRWETYASTGTRVRWLRAHAGNIDNQGADELVLTGERGVLHVYQIEGGAFVPLMERASLDRPWVDAAIGRFHGGPTADIAAVRSTNIELPRFLTFIYDPSQPDNFRDGYSEFFAPSPRRVFFADINGNGEDEVFLLRGTLAAPPPPTPTAAARAHLIMRNRGGDQVREFEVVLDADGGYQAGVGADVDGDGRDEVIIARNNKIRIYFEPEVSLRAVDNDLSTDSSTLYAGNLDSLGFLRFPELVAAPSAILDARVVPGQGTPARYTIELTVQNPLLNVPADYEFVVSVPSNAPWLIVTPTNGRLPATLQVEIIGEGLRPLDRLEATIVVTVVDGAQFTEPVSAIPVQVRVLPGLSPRPAAALAFAPCDPAPTETEPIVIEIALEGLIGVPFSARLIPENPDWVALENTATHLPAGLTLRFYPEQRDPNHTVETAELVIDSQTNQGDPLQVTVPVRLFCEEARLLLPLVER